MRCSAARVVVVAGALAMALAAQYVLRSAPVPISRARRAFSEFDLANTVEAGVGESTSFQGDSSGFVGLKGGYEATSRTSSPIADEATLRTDIHTAAALAAFPRASEQPQAAKAAATSAGRTVPAMDCEGETGALRFEHLQLNRHAKRLWGCASADSGVRAVFLTFGSHSMADFLLNWVAHVKRLGQRLVTHPHPHPHPHPLSDAHPHPHPLSNPLTLSPAPARAPAPAPAPAPSPSPSHTPSPSPSPLTLHPSPFTLHLTLILITLP